MENPTIIVGHLNNEELQKSIDTLVAKVDEGMKLIVKKTNTAVEAMENKLKSLGGIKFDGGGSTNGGSSKKAVDAINSVIAAQDKQIITNVSSKLSYKAFTSISVCGHMWHILYIYRRIKQEETPKLAFLFCQGFVHPI